MPKTLLLADDSVTIQKVVGISFANEDVVLLTVDNGDDAVTRAQEARPDLVLADIAMPGKDGYEVCEAIKADPALRHIPVLLLSGTFETFDEDRARAVGADGHITKPFEAQALVDRVNDLLARGASAMATPAPDATVLVGEASSAGESFDFFDEEFSASVSELPASEPATTHVVATEDDALDLDQAVEVSSGEPIAIGSFQSGASAPATDANTTLLFDADVPEIDVPSAVSPPPLPPEAFAQTAWETTRSSSRPPVLEPAATQLLMAEDADDAEGLDFGLDDAVEEAVVATAHEPDDTDIEDADEADAADDLFEAVAVPEPAPAPAFSPTPAATGTGSSAHLDALRGELREHLEKVAWEAFGDLSDRIVRETVTRIESIAWEVIPQMAEALIQEEIRKLQSDPE
jgi:CheY-like chemotaxis protein